VKVNLDGVALMCGDPVNITVILGPASRAIGSICRSSSSSMKRCNGTRCIVEIKHPRRVARIMRNKTPGVEWIAQDVLSQLLGGFAGVA